MKIAIVGGICSGKSEVMAVLKNLGAYIVKTDDINRQLLQNADYIASLAQVFPTVVNHGVLDKVALRNIIMQDDVARAKLNRLAHPRIFEEVERLASVHNGITFVENPLIVSTNSAKYFDEIWSVVSPIEDRLKRLIVRDNISKQQAIVTFEAQKAEEKAQEIANCIINNTGDKQELKLKVEKLYAERVAR